MPGCTFNRKCLHIALSSDKLQDVVDQTTINRYRNDWKHLSELRRAVRVRYQETVDLRDYEPRIQKLLDDHVTAMPAETIIESVNINDPASLRAVVEDAGVSTTSMADRIASATRRTIIEKMNEDPALYQRFSTMLQETIDDYRARRIAEREYLQQVLSIAKTVGDRDRGTHLPAALAHDDDAAAIFGVLDDILPASSAGAGCVSRDDQAEIAKELVGIVKNHLIVGIWSNIGAQNNLLNALDDYCWKELETRRSIHMSAEATDQLQQRVLSIARARFPR